MPIPPCLRKRSLQLIDVSFDLISKKEGRAVTDLLLCRRMWWLLTSPKCCMLWQWLVLHIPPAWPAAQHPEFELLALGLQSHRSLAHLQPSQWTFELKKPAAISQHLHWDTWLLLLDCMCPIKVVTGPGYKHGLDIACCAWSFSECQIWSF